MSINITVANTQAGKLRDFAKSLRSAKTQLGVYRQNISSNWSADEVAYISDALRKSQTELEKAASELESLGCDIEGAAAAIKKEDDIKAAQSVYDKALEAKNTLCKKLEELKTKLSLCVSDAQKETYQKEINDLDGQIKNAELKCTSACSALNAAKR